jgi:hypothetical protein
MNATSQRSLDLRDVPISNGSHGGKEGLFGNR